MYTPISSRFHSLIRTCKQVLTLPDDTTVTTQHVEQLTQIMRNHLEVDNLSPANIAAQYGIEHRDFGMFLKSSLKLKLKTFSEANKAHRTRTGTALTDDKKIYKANCQFKFGIYDNPNIPGYELLETIGLYNSVSNVDGASRDHMFSVEEGWRHQVDPTLISHPANCMIMAQPDNSKKNSSSSITLDQLKTRVAHWNENGLTKNPELVVRALTKSEDHKKKISETLKKYITVTNGATNLRLLKNESIPDGYWRGMTSKSGAATPK